VRRLRDGEITETPSGIGGSPATVASRLHQAVTWLNISSGDLIIGDQEARISISASLLRPVNLPNDALVTRVTVPLGALYSQPASASESKNHDQPT
jgi:hypothetical protein